jgi:pimeloyl-ACP methyl ester carboxylesterase
MTDRTPLVLLYGFLCDAALWRHQTDTLSDIAEPIVPDLTPFDDPAEAVKSLLPTLPEKFALAGLSMGGYLAFEFMRQAPERVTKLALLDTTAREDAPDKKEQRKGFAEKALQPDFDIIATSKHMLGVFIHEDRMTDQPLVDDILAMCERFGAQAFSRHMLLMARRPDSRADLGAITCPTLVLCGRQDGLIPLEENAEIADGIPNATFVIVEDSGHLSTMEQPHAVSAVLRYWLNAK